MHTRTERLLALMLRHNLTVAEVADILGRQPATVRIWRVTANDHRVIPEHALALLEARLASQ